MAKINNDTALLVKELVHTIHVDDAELANHIAKEIVADLKTYVEQHLAKYQKYTLNAPTNLGDGNDTSQFFNLIGLLKDVSVLGRKLLESAPNYHNTQKKIPSSLSSPNLTEREVDLGKSLQALSLRDEDATSEDLLAALIESSSTDDFLVLSSLLDSITLEDMILTSLIYIKCHDCFTLSHDIQGVSMVLRRIKFMILNILAQKNQMELITRLLTSIGRYNEMNYVFDLFRDRNQFEILLSKGVEKTPELRIALFNYVKTNPEFYPLVTLNFSMFREIAESLEASALRRLDKVIASRRKDPVVSFQSQQKEVNGPNEPRGDSDNRVNGGGRCGVGRGLYSKEGLRLSLVELVDASDCFAKAGCYKKSNYCERKAKLVALQLALLPSGTNVLALTQSELNDLIVSFQSFNNAYMVAQAYDYHLAWRQALFKNVILQGHSAYLHNYCKKCDLSSALVEELVLLYKKYINSHQLSQEDGSKLAKAMKMLLQKIPDVELKCKLYAQLNFDDAKEQLLLDAATYAHLLDLRLA